MRLPRIDVRETDDAVVATVTDGDIDITSAADVGDLLLESVPNHVLGLVVVLDAVTYIDSAGIRTLFGLARQLATSRQVLGVAIPESSPLQRLFAITKLGEVAVIGPDVDGCLEAIRPPA